MNTLIEKAKCPISFNLKNYVLEVTPTMIERTKIILAHYHEATWNTIENVEDMHEEAAELGGRRIQDILDLLYCDISDEINTYKLEKQLLSISQTKVLIEIVDITLMRLRACPYDGERYYTIITEQFTSRRLCSCKETMIKLGLGRAQYYRQKNKALQLFSWLLFEKVLPHLTHFAS